jgi:hypothetical protein
MQLQASSSYGGDIFREVSLAECTEQAQAVIWLYLTIVTEFLIFVVRVPQNACWTGQLPHPFLVVSVVFTQVLFSILAGVWLKVWIGDIFITWGFGVGAFAMTDLTKVLFFRYVAREEASETISWSEYLDCGDEEFEIGQQIKKEVGKGDLEAKESADETRRAAKENRHKKILSYGVQQMRERNTGSFEVLPENFTQQQFSWSMLNPRAHKKLC